LKELSKYQMLTKNLEKEVEQDKARFASELHSLSKRVDQMSKEMADVRQRQKARQVSEVSSDFKSLIGESSTD